MKKLFLLILMLFTLFSFNTNTIADLGDFNDYSSDDDYSYSDDSNDYDDYDYYDSDDDYYSDENYDDEDYSDDSDVTFTDVVIAVVIIIIIIIVIMFAGKNKNNKNNNGGNGGNGGSTTVSYGKNINVPDNTDEIVDEIIKNDPNYSNDKFIAWTKEVFITLQTAWSERDFDKCRPFEKEELFKQHMTQIQGYKDRGQINKLGRININQAYLYKYVRDKEYEYLTVYMQARMSDYIIDEKSGNVVKGDPNTEYHSKYLYTFIRKVGVTTDPAKSNKSTTACPHCGAPTQITSSGKCEYCGFIITTGEFDWVLSNIESVKNTSNIDAGGVKIRE